MGKQGIGTVSDCLLQAAVMIFMLHLCDGFEPVEMGKTLAVACLASVAFMSVMYFFTNTFGKVGSFLMLVFMVIQLEVLWEPTPWNCPEALSLIFMAGYRSLIRWKPSEVPYQEEKVFRKP